jgi:N-acyl-D-amino-acid deacylase
MADLVIRGGTVLDGTGSPAVTADIAISGGLISAIGPNLPKGSREIDARGLLITPGFVDIHTHYDGQATWDEELAPSTPHGVTTLVMGNCGVGFAPARREDHATLIELMEGVEDIPGAALHEGISWNWESFPEYLDALEARQYTADIGAMIAHGPLRTYVMGMRGAKNEPAAASDIAEMARLAEDAMNAGAFGFSTSRTINHRAMDGEPVPGTFAAEEELFAIGRALGRSGRGVFEVAPAGLAGEDLVAPEREIDWVCRMSAEIGRPVTWLMLQNNVQPDAWKHLMQLSVDAQAKGYQVVPQVAGRPFGVLIGLSGMHRFKDCPSFAPLLEKTVAEKAAAMRSLDLRAKLIAESAVRMDELRTEFPVVALILDNFDQTYTLGDPVDYEPSAERSIAHIARTKGVTPVEACYDALLEREGGALLMQPFLGYSHGNGDALREMLTHPAAVLGLADGGAHCNAICDASTPTWMLTHWTRDRTRGEKLDLAHVIKKLTRDPADLFGFTDRGVLKVGYRADVNVIDYENLTLREPALVADLPAGGTRFLQAAEGYRYTIVAGEITRQDDRFTGARPGRLVRSTQFAAGAQIAAE